MQRETGVMTSPIGGAERIVLLSDDAWLRDQILLPGLGEYGFAITGVGTEVALYECLRRMEAPDAVVLDFNMRGIDGFGVSQTVRALLPQAGIIIFTGRVDAEQLRGTGQGADVYLVRPVHLEILAANLRSLARRVRAHVQVVPARRWRFDVDEWYVTSPNGRIVSLSKTEQRVMDCLVSALGQLVTREQLVSVLAEDARDYDLHRIESLVHRLRRKIATQCGEILPLIAVNGKGYILDDAHRDNVR